MTTHMTAHDDISRASSALRFDIRSGRYAYKLRMFLVARVAAGFDHQRVIVSRGSECCDILELRLDLKGKHLQAEGVSAPFFPRSCLELDLLAYCESI